MTEGHGDDAYRYPDIRYNFSSNIYARADLSELKSHLCRSIGLIDHYPEPEPCSLRDAIARKHGIPADCVLVTSGATDAIYLIAEAFSRRAGCHYALAALPTFSEYEDACRMYGIPLAAAAGPATMLWLCNPNNPTGQAFSCQEITALARRHAYVVVDQSYEDYTLSPAMTPREAVASGNIIQLHSLTKTYAIPGLRVGYVVAAPPIIGLLRGHIRPWAVNALAVEAGRWLVEHDVKAVPDLPAYLAETERLRQQLNCIPGIHAAPTSTSFMLATIEQTTAAQLKEWLARQHHMLIRDASNFRGLGPHHFRISTQTTQANDLLMAALRDYVKNMNKNT